MTIAKQVTSASSTPIMRAGEAVRAGAGGVIAGRS
jgi:hypothetical protein